MAINTWSQMAALLPLLIVSSAIDGGVTWTPHFPRGTTGLIMVKDRVR